MKNIIIAAVIIFALTTTSQEMFSQKRDHRNGKEFRLEQIEKLNLTVEQKSKLESLRHNHEVALIKLNADLDLKELEMKKLKSNESIYRNEMINLTKEISLIKNEIALARTHHQMDVYDNLDVNQRKIWMDMQKRMGDKKSKMKEKVNHRIHERRE
ncbi:MAG: hypothetical protein WAU11_16560 [Ignavibacteriaceae bacterium]